jgi:hypoxanthine phosphoribosyltransferase
MDFTFEKNVGQIVLTADEIAKGISDTAALVSEEYTDKNLLIVGVLKGSFVFIADFIRAMTIPCTVDFMRVSSYGDGDRPSDLHILLDTYDDFSGYDVLVLEDIIDTGRTLRTLNEMFLKRNPRSLRVITLIDKPSRREVEYTPDTAIFTIPDLFIIGYGLDYNEFGRNLPFIAEFISAKEVINE